MQSFYGVAGLLSYTIDAKGQKFERVYDAYNRVVELRKYPNGVTEYTTQRVTYYYDVNPFTPGYTQNGWGRVAAVQYARRYPNQGYDLSFVEQFSYTQGGLPTKKHCTAPDSEKRKRGAPLRC